MRLQRLRRMARSLRCDCDGSALIEATIVVPVLFVLLFGVFEFSWLFYQQHLVSTGLRDAARYLARTADPTSATSQSYAARLATTGTITSGGTLRVPGWTVANVSCQPQSVPNPIDELNLRVTTAGANQVVTCSTNFAYLSLGLFGFLGLTAPSLAVAHSERAIVDAP
jgi:Flp pilus assembly protein TadG